MAIDWIAKLRNFLQIMAFCLVVATVQYAFRPDRPYGPPVLYSIFIGGMTWAFIDLGRHLFPSATETGWPRGLSGLLLVVGGIAGGYLLGSSIADRLCQLYQFYPPGPVPDKQAELRSSLLITALAGIAGSYYFYSINKSAYLERKMGEARKHADEARLKLLETQLEPHMLFNTLANLRALIGVDPPRAQTMLDHMIAYLRATLDGSRTTTHSLEAEFARLKDYLELMSIRMGPRLQFTFTLPRELAQHRVPTLLLQPLVENCIQHGLEPKVQGGTINVTASRQGDDLVLEVADTGVGPSGAPSNGKGFGMSQVRERLATLYGPAASMDFSAVDGAGARTRIRFPINA